MSNRLYKIHKNGGKVILLSQHTAQQQKTTDDLITRLEKLNNSTEW